MGTKVRELRPITEQGMKHDPRCRACGAPTPSDEVSASDLWEAAQRRDDVVIPFRTAMPDVFNVIPLRREHEDPTPA